MRIDANDPDWQTRPAKANDLAWLLDIGNATRYANGFTPRAAIADHIERDDYTILILRGQRAAFMFTSGGRRSPFRIVQSAVSLELWRQGYGEMLFGSIALRAITRPIPATTCAVRDGLESNRFWVALGAQHIDTTPGGKSRKRMLLHYAWRTTALHQHALNAASDPRHKIPEHDTIARFIDSHGFIPFTTAVPRTKTSDAQHHAGITIPLIRRKRKRTTTTPTTSIECAPTVPSIPD